MESADRSSQEILDKMLQEGKVSQEDYLRLSRALSKQPDLPEDPESTRRHRLFKSWKDRRLGGVCGGLANYFRIDPIIVRIIVAIFLCIATPVILVAYFLMYFMLPWDDEEANLELERRGQPRWLALLGILFSTLSSKRTFSAHCYRGLPWQVWMTMGVLVVSGIIQFPIFVTKKPLVALTIIILDALLAIGLFHKKKWAFVLTLGFCFISIIAIGKNPSASIFNVVLGIILFTAHPCFFPKSDPTQIDEKEC